MKSFRIILLKIKTNKSGKSQNWKTSTIELEKKAKMHIADSFRVTIEEKDDLIEVLKTQVDKDIKELKIEKNPLEEGNYDEIHEKVKENFDTDHKLDMDPLGDVEVS
ncbi:uncharacterized protein LOC124459198 [Xenia sp. Carnegie-2017]|uniref:uncharacterized protein LOC124459198 n=1 Tax=Xenia sp. Carnegie-2017 TaxID=2897299 RepID=UPI001F038F7A|nr:uncharacterized protein LOC124459198 [Xenia sp. Carnegie-2017]